jgi:hypothetical protein
MKKMWRGVENTAATAVIRRRAMRREEQSDMLQGYRIMCNVNVPWLM